MYLLIDMSVQDIIVLKLCSKNQQKSIKKEGRNGLATEWIEEYEKKNLALWTSFNQPFSNHR